jgi:hypothetical protein
MTIYELKRLNQKNGGCFFNRDTMRHFGDTMKNFGVQRYTSDTVKVYRKLPTVKGMAGHGWLFDTENGLMLATFTLDSDGGGFTGSNFPGYAEKDRK